MKLFKHIVTLLVAATSLAYTADLTEQVYYDYTKIDGFIWSASFDGEKFIEYPEKHQWQATLNVDAYQKYLNSVFDRMKEGGMNQINLSFAQIASIDVLLSGDYSTSKDPFVMVLHNEKFLGPDGKYVDMLKLFVDTAHQAGIRVDIAFGGEDASGLKICGPGETATGQAQKLAQFMDHYGFDSVDFDLEDTGAEAFAKENTRTEQREFFAELQKELSAKSRSVILTIEGATSWGTGTLKALFYDDAENQIFKDLFNGLNLMLYSQTQYYINANDKTWGIEQWLEIIGKENVSMIHIGFEDHVPYENPDASAGEHYHITTKNRGAAAAQVYQQLGANLQADGYTTPLGNPFWWPDEGIDSYQPDQTNSVISDTMVDFYNALHS
ncbi:MAG: hypothetical protein H7A41_06840 [Chlamydiales bacterium]|nr:hypothetical protein [Chlamydiales bacterium]